MRWIGRMVGVLLVLGYASPFVIMVIMPVLDRLGLLE